MNAPALTSPAERRRVIRPERRRPRRGAALDARCRDAGGPTLEDSIVATLAELKQDGRAVCPVCAAPELLEVGCQACESELR